MEVIARPTLSDCDSDSRLAEADRLRSAQEAELIAGLTRPEKCINPKYFYDEKGSQLFERITALPEYYATRAEISILQDNATDIATQVGRRAGSGPVLIEPGAGSCEKVRHLLDSLQPAVYLPQDISADFLLRTTAELQKSYPWLTISPLTGDFSQAIRLPHTLPEGCRIVFYPGSTIGNFEPDAASGFLAGLRSLIGKEGAVIVGVDLPNDTPVLEAAYNDSAGITAKFNLNILNNVNLILNADFDLSRFEHLAFYNKAETRIEMHLVSRCDQLVHCRDSLTFSFRRGERIHTEHSYKYADEAFASLATDAGLHVAKTWSDAGNRFRVHLLKPSGIAQSRPDA